MSSQLSFLRDELRELTDAIATTEEVAQEVEDSFAWELSLDNLRARREELLAEIQAALEEARVAELRLRFEGTPVQSGTIEAGFLSEFLGYLQKVVSSLGQAIASQPTARGTIPESITERARLRLAAVQAGSFTVDLVGETQPNLFGESLIEECFENLHALIEAGDNANSLADLLSSLGGRVQGHYTAFLNSLTSADASVELQTWEGAATPRTAELSPSRAKNIADALSLLQREDEKLEQFSGCLIGLLQHKAQFEFRVSTTERIIAGKVLPSALQKAVDKYNSDIIADFNVEVMGVEGREEVTENWTLVDVNSATVG